MAHRACCAALAGAVICTAVSSILFLSNAALAASPTVAGTREPAALFAEGTAAYERGDYPASSRTFAAIAAGGLHHEAVYYNLGCSLAREGRYGEAALAFRRALHFNPGDRDSRENMNWVRERLPDDVAARFDLLVALARVTDVLPQGAALSVALLLWWAAAAAAGVALTLPHERAGRARRRLIGAATLLGTLAALAAIGPTTASLARRFDSGVVILADRIDARSGPGSSNPALFTVHAGFEVEAREARRGWVRIGTADGLSGWIPEETLASVRPLGPGMIWPRASEPASSAEEPPVPAAD